MAHYVKNKDLREEIAKCKAEDKLSDKAIIMFQLMADKYSRTFNYIHDDDRRDCISVAVIDCYKYWKGYDPEISDNAFAYYTTVIRNGFSKAWRILGYIALPKSKRVSLNQHKIYSL